MTSAIMIADSRLQVAERHAGRPMAKETLLSLLVALRRARSPLIRRQRLSTLDGLTGMDRW
jgi:hypothetical protein